MHINVVKGLKDTFGAKTFMGRAAVPIRPYADRPGETVEDWFDLGRGEWSNEDGTVRASAWIMGPNNNQHVKSPHEEKKNQQKEPCALKPLSTASAAALCAACCCAVVTISDGAIGI